MDLPYLFPVWLFDLQHLAGKDFASRGQFVDSQELSKGHVVASGDLVRAVTPADNILVGAGYTRAFNAVFRNLQALPDIEGGSIQTIEGLDFLGGGSILPRNDPEGIPAANFVDDGFPRGFLYACFCIGYDGSPLGDFQFLPGHDKIGRAQVVGPFNTSDTGSVFIGNAGKRLTRPDTMVHVGRSWWVRNRKTVDGCQQQAGLCRRHF